MSTNIVVVIVRFSFRPESICGASVKYKPLLTPSTSPNTVTASTVFSLTAVLYLVFFVLCRLRAAGVQRDGQWVRLEWHFSFFTFLFPSFPPHPISFSFFLAVVRVTCLPQLWLQTYVFINTHIPHTHATICDGKLWATKYFAML